ncbi:LysR family transcriptional regulator [Lactobacillus sp. Sy-1]|uniref:LysR family transcriptional regulator n=1 Tax=Lactobacillus sp. Sy-1 TaxID=2109645 RepID=UPI001C5BCB38|nr:LysR family transcriptional regulator [Lactobacillus sp. Sy-1]MBW1606192.1 LysR family transcriptional regulator [Lactobacillus sp. Sy-1]
MFTLNQLRYFYTLAQKLNYRMAADELYISEPALSKQIHQLEANLNLKLFQKQGRNIVLSKDGHQIMIHVVKVLRQIDELSASVEQIQNPNNASLRIGISGNQMVYKHLRALKVAFPNLSVHLKELQSAKIVQQLKAGELDLGVTYLPVNDNELTNRFILNDDLLVVGSKNNPLLSQRTSIDLTTLSQMELAVLSDDYYVRRMLDRFFAEELIIPSYQFELNNYQSCINMVLNTNALTVIPRSFLSTNDFKMVTVIPINNAPLKLRMGLITLKTTPLSKPMQVLRALLING